MVTQIIYSFEAAHQRGELPNISDYLAGDTEPSMTLVVELVQIDVEYRLQRKLPVAVSDYLSRWPQLRKEGNILSKLVRAEIRHRQTKGESVSFDEFVHLYPELASVPLETHHQSTIHTEKQPPQVTIPQIEGYEILEEIGRGGMAVVYKARHKKLNRLAAVKFILAGAHAGEEEISRFRREARTVASLHHPGIVQIHDVGEHQGLIWLSLEYCDGGNLAQRLLGKPLPPREAAAVVQKLAEAMQAAHDRGIIHRDLKPANVLLAGEPAPANKERENAHNSDATSLASFQLKIADFGLARKLDETLHTLSGAVIGTPPYMAPEQALGRAGAIGPATDVYSLGAVLYECLTGRPPFRGPTVVDTILQVINDDPVPVRSLVPSTPRDLDTIVLKCLHKQRDRRYQSASELADDLRRFLVGEPIRARTTPQWEQAWKWVHRHPTTSLIGISTLIALLVLGFVWHGLSRQRVLAQAQERVAALSVADAEGVPYVLEQLAPLRLESLPILRARLEETNDERTRVRVACGLAALGEPPIDILVNSVLRVPTSPGECQNLVTALNVEREKATLLLRELFSRENDLSHRFRLAVVLLHLGDSNPAAQMLEAKTDPSARTQFIHGYPTWHGDLRQIAEVLRTPLPADLRSGICAGLGLIEPGLVAVAAREPLLETLQTLFVEAPDGGTHSAASYALTRRQATLPELPRRLSPEPGKGWFVSPRGLTMIEIPRGTYRRGNLTDPSVDSDKNPHQVTLTRSFFLSDREVWVGLFRAFQEDRDPQMLEADLLSDHDGTVLVMPAKALPGKVRIGKWPGPFNRISPTDQHPVQRVSWFDAVLFCNWLSVREGRTPCYEFAESGRSGSKGTLPVVNLRLGTNGYRLPTDAEWEYACRARSEAVYCYGNDEEPLRHYATYSSVYAKPANLGGTRLPNAWGLYDMHGNVWEWCHDWWTAFTAEPLTDPTGPAWLEPPQGKIRSRTIRGGGISNSRGDWRSATRGYNSPLARFYNLGFRVACSSPGS